MNHFCARPCKRARKVEWSKLYAQRASSAILVLAAAACAFSADTYLRVEAWMRSSIQQYGSVMISWSPATLDKWYCFCASNTLVAQSSALFALLRASSHDKNHNKPNIFWIKNSMPLGHCPYTTATATTPNHSCQISQSQTWPRHRLSWPTGSSKHWRKHLLLTQRTCDVSFAHTHKRNCGEELGRKLNPFQYKNDSLQLAWARILFRIVQHHYLSLEAFENFFSSITTVDKLSNTCKSRGICKQYVSII